MDENHWDDVYGRKGARDVSWFTPSLERSLAWIDGLELDRDASILDMGAGASTLVDDLLGRGFSNLTAVDLSEVGLATARERLGARAASVRWIVSEATRVRLDPASVDVWHDRAVFHFLTDDASRAAYVRRASEAVRSGGHLLVATFAQDGPERCSGLPVRRHSVDELTEAFADAFERVDAVRAVHETPWGSEQAFVHVLMKRRSP